MLRGLRFSFIALTAAACLPSVAAPTTYYFGGTFTTASGTAAGNLNQAFAGQLVYDPSWTGTQLTGTPTTGRIAYPLPAGALAGASVTGSGSSTGGALTRSWQDQLFVPLLPSASPSDDALLVGSNASFSGTWTGSDRMLLMLRDGSASANGAPFSALPPSLPALSAWDLTYFAIIDNEEETFIPGGPLSIPGDPSIISGAQGPTSGGVAYGALTCWSTAPDACVLLPAVPEPATAALLLSGLGLLAMAARRRGRRATAP